MKGSSWIKEVLLSLLVLLTLADYAFAAAQDSFKESPKVWLKRMADAAKTVSYRGVFVYQEGALLETLAITRDADNGRDKERIIYLDGLPREVVRNAGVLTYSTLERGVTRFNHGSLVPMVGKFANVFADQNYQVSYASDRFYRVAGREAVVLSIIPVDRYRYGYQLWLDAKTALPLKSVMLGGRGNIMERLQFTHIETGANLTKPELQAMDKSNIRSDKVVNIEKSSEKGGVWNWEAGWVPEGFAIKSVSQRPSPVSSHKTDAVIYSDGVASFSIFVEPDETKVLSQASENIGTLAAVSKVFRRGDTFFHVTVVGEVPLGTAERVAVSVRPRKDAAAIESSKE